MTVSRRTSAHTPGLPARPVPSKQPWQIVIERPAIGRAEGAERKESFFADLVVVADNCLSNFRSSVMEGAFSVVSAGAML